MGYIIDKDWLLKIGDKEDNMCISAGAPLPAVTAALKTRSVRSAKYVLRDAASKKITSRKKQTKKAS
jgi:hypothetical protein